MGDKFAGAVPETAALKKPRGRPRFDQSAPRLKKSISLYPKVGELLRQMGGGVVSHGIEIAAGVYRSLTPEGVEGALARQRTSFLGNEVEKMSVSLSGTTYEMLLVVGDGTLSHGVTKVAEVALCLRHEAA